MEKIMLVFGTRPEAIKMAPLVKEFQKYPERYNVIVCVTAQHREMLDQVLRLFEIEPDYDLDLMEHGQDLYDVTSRVLLGMRDVLNRVKPNLVLVHGDTATSTAAALAAFYKKIPVGHIEAGLRTYDIYSPWPEEVNRQLTSRIATYHFAPTELSKKNLLNEGVKLDSIIVTGNTVIDALFSVLDSISNKPELAKNIFKTYALQGISETVYQSWINKERRLILITGHRRENFGERFIQICEAIKALSEKYNDVDFVYPMHLNPNVRDAIKHVFGSTEGTQNVFFIEPLEYLPFVFLMSNSYVILTDSGGIQEEAPGLGKPVLVMRDTTERPEALKAGTVKLVGANKTTIVNSVSELVDSDKAYHRMAKANNPYGDGKASNRVVESIMKIQTIINEVLLK